MKIVTSFSGRLYYTTGKDALQTVAREKSTILAYHENSMENTHPMSGRTICEVDKIEGVEYLDLFESVPALKSIISYPEWAKGKTYLNTNSPFFLRKTAAMWHAVTHNPPDIFLWLDCDCYMKKPFSQSLTGYISQFDICYLDRQRISTDTGVIFFNVLKNPRVIDFVKEWYTLYLSKGIFKIQGYDSWADTDAFDFLRKKYNKLFSFGPLQSGKGRKVWFQPEEWLVSKKKNPWSVEEGWEHILHLKHPLKKIRKPIESSRSITTVNRGHLYVAFGSEYDKVGAHSVAYLRKVSSLPVHVVTNVPVASRHPEWSKLSNVTFSYVSMPNESNRVPKTLLCQYSPFDETLYTDVDSLICSSKFMEVFELLKQNDILLPIWRHNIRENEIPEESRPLFSKLLRQFPREGFHPKQPLTIYGGGTCAFKKNDKVHRFFLLFNEYWNATGRGRDMPALAITAATCMGKISIGLLSNDYNRHNSKIVKSVHGNARSKHLPSYVAYRPNPQTNQWEHRQKNGSWV